MKLIDLLVQELPKRGGWPEKARLVVQDSSGYVNFFINQQPVYFDNHWVGGDWIVSTNFYADAGVANDHATAIITREQYEAALAAAQQPVWDGEGLPPVGAEVEVRYRHATNAEWVFFRCVAVDCEAAFGWTEKVPAGLSVSDYDFRPILSEADRKRAAVVTALAKAGGDVHFEYGRKTIDGELSSPGWYKLYDKIAAGEIAGIRIE
ncbi:hypothetical protein ROM83_04445 [Cronobacter sakazakii]|uniref:hypothetical protein n=1 Tax=Cronobacter sakazakii TaxID=28141 RepID=UPI00289448BB|nr:hypothetical protein [Cronobacter sakazakii]MDT3523226.1 hypothetical protein [Cronobacter sakazakii]